MSATQEFFRNGFLISADNKQLSIETVCRFLAQSHWAKNRKKETIVKSIENSLCYGIYKEGKQLGFARVVTDYSTFAYLCDVYIDENHRGLGLSKWLMECVMNHPDLQSLRRFTLATKDAHGLYAKFGFKAFSGEENRRFMSILKDNV